MYMQIWIGIIVEEIFLTMAVCDWIQLPIVEPDIGKVKLKSPSHEQESNFQLQSSKGDRTVGINTAIKRNANISFNQRNINKSFRQNITGIPIGNHKSDLKTNYNESFPEISFLTTNSRVSASYDMAQSHFNSNEITTLLPTEWPYESLLETEATNIHMPHIHVHLKTNLNSPDNEEEKLTNKTSQWQSDMDIPDINIMLTHDRSNSEKPVLSNSNKAEDILAQDTSSTELPLDMLKTVHQTMIQKIPQSIQGKLQFLQQLQNKMLSYMEKHIRNLWTTELERQARTEKGMAFPSMEGALMSISFLTFAVFLIKLVQQLIQCLQGNTMAAMMTRRQARSVPDLLTTARVLQLVDEFPFHHAVKGK